MKASLAMTLGLGTVALPWLFLEAVVVTPAEACDNSMATVVAVSLPTLGDAEAQYVGSRKCMKCHMKQMRSWASGKKAKTLEVLLPGNAAEVKAKFDLDSSKDYSKDETCLGCHTTGYGHEGGYFIADPADTTATKQARKLAGVGCEACHGPGGEYIKLHKEIMKAKRSYKTEEMYAAGLWKIEESVCVRCHNDKSATYDPTKPFDFDKMKDQGAHVHTPLKQRED
ncbi:MAG: multiheme c-type cytochrome [Phycisphaerae bacterium]